MHSRLVAIAAAALLAGAAAAAAAAAAPPADAVELFSDRVVRTFSLELPESRWETLRAHALEKRTAAARLAVDGVPVGVVGVRFKGAAGTLASCVRDGAPVCPKLPLRLRFDHYAPERRFLGLSRLNLHAMKRDPSLMREHLAYRLFAEAGVPAPRSAWARLVVNGRDQGLFLLVEAIDARFADLRFHLDDGLLYKEAWPASLDPAYYQERLRSNRGEPQDHAAMLAFARELAQAPPGARGAVLSRWTDADALARYLAVDRLIGNWDGISAWFCDGHACNNHNFYWYAERARRRLHLVPWDLDDALRLFDPLSVAGEWLEPPASCSARPLAWGDRAVRHAACDPLMEALAELARERLPGALRALLDGPFAEPRVRAQLAAWRALLAPHVARDPHGPRPALWEGEVEALLASLAPLRARAEALASGSPVTPVALSLARRNGFEDASEEGLRRSFEATSNARSRVAIGLGLSRALAGRADLRLDFALRNDSLAPADRFLQWAQLRLPFEGGAADLSGVDALRLRVRADSPRTLWVAVESPRYGSPDAALRWGWELRAGPEARSATLRMRDLRLPAWSSAAPVPLAEVLARASALVLDPQPVGRLASGFLPEGRADHGWLRVDELEFSPREKAGLRR